MPLTALVLGVLALLVLCTRRPPRDEPFSESWFRERERQDVKREYLERAEAHERSWYSYWREQRHG